MKFTKEAADRQPEGNGRWSAIPNGYAQSLVSLAFDVYLLQHKKSLPDDWLRRLRLRDQYQGVRYEIAVASIFVRVGCTLEFYEDRRGTAKHAEFKANDEATGATVAVEAKSRHRAGVIHQTGTFDEDKAIKGDLTGLFNNALQKDPEGLPYVVFLDVNTPRDVNTPADQTRWFADVRKMITRQHTATASDPDTYALVTVTNYSHHYEGPELVTASQTCVIMPVFSTALFPGGSQGVFFLKLRTALDGYGFVPNL